MNSDQQIEEMANACYEAMLKARETLGSMNEGAPKWYAKELYAKGYRKASEIARNIIRDVRDAWATSFTESEFLEMLKDIEKKYEEGE